MASKSEPKRVIYSPEAREDLALNYEFTAHNWGLDQAERYALFLTDAAVEIASQPQNGKKLTDTVGIFVILVHWKNARYCHNIVYRETESGIYVLRILHSSMDLPLHIVESQ